ncbi:MAG: UDP-N-acetylmuramate--L-alanine ligase [Candidatus Latescibacteria bacterium]|nr:UDP-N-acetylmuramate--L-alanine ligase [Candidatus Latescibacterota bacterium]
MHLGRTRHLHLVAIGGIGMSGIAEILVNSGFTVTGSDQREGPALERLRSFGVVCHVGHRAEQVEGAHVVVYSSAVPQDNPELVEARERGIPVISRGEMLAELMRLKRGIAITGSHGKTSTSSLVAEVLHAGGLDPTAVVGGRLLSFGSNARLGAGPHMVAEADESDGSFQRLAPTWAVVTNVDNEHLDHYGDFATLRAAVLGFLNRVPFYGASILCLEDPTLRAMLPEIRGRVVGYGWSDDCALKGEIVEQHPGGTRFRWRSARFGGELELPVLGRHNVLNALAAVAVGLELDVSPEDIGRGLSAFQGVGRRFQVLGSVDDIIIMDDYGHHPTEIARTLEAAREHFGRRLRVVFQPHRYSRTRMLADEFGEAFDAADDLILTEIYAAGEAPIEGVDAGLIERAVASRGRTPVRRVGEKDAIAALLMDELEPGDLVLTLGAGDLNRFAEDLLKRLEATRGVR